jgi:hypothetical protein
LKEFQESFIILGFPALQEKVLEGKVVMDEENPLEKCDRRNYTILAAVGILLIIISVLGLLSGNGLLPTMWGEISIILVLGVLYNWAIRKKRVDLRLGLIYSTVGIPVSFVVFTIQLFGMYRN